MGFSVKQDSTSKFVAFLASLPTTIEDRESNRCEISQYPQQYTDAPGISKSFIHLAHPITPWK